MLVAVLEIQCLYLNSNFERSFFLIYIGCNSVSTKYGQCLSLFRAGKYDFENMLYEVRVYIYYNTICCFSPLSHSSEWRCYFRHSPVSVVIYLSLLGYLTVSQTNRSLFFTHSKESRYRWLFLPEQLSDGRSSISAIFFAFS